MCTYKPLTRPICIIPVSVEAGDAAEAVTRIKSVIRANFTTPSQKMYLKAWEENQYRMEVLPQGGK